MYISTGNVGGNATCKGLVIGLVVAAFFGDRDGVISSFNIIACFVLNVSTSNFTGFICTSDINAGISEFDSAVVNDGAASALIVGKAASS